MHFTFKIFHILTAGCFPTGGLLSSRVRGAGLGWDGEGGPCFLLNNLVKLSWISSASLSISFLASGPRPFGDSFGDILSAGRGDVLCSRGPAMYGVLILDAISETDVRRTAERFTTPPTILARSRKSYFPLSNRLAPTTFDTPIFQTTVKRL